MHVRWCVLRGGKNVCIATDAETGMTYRLFQGRLGSHQTACVVAGQAEDSIQEDLKACAAEGLEVAIAPGLVAPSQARPELLHQP